MQWLWLPLSTLIASRAAAERVKAAGLPLQAVCHGPDERGVLWTLPRAHVCVCVCVCVCERERERESRSYMRI